MIRKTLATVCIGVLAVTTGHTQSGSPEGGATAAGQRGGRAGGGRGGGGGSSHYPTAEQWATMSDRAKAYVEKAKTLAGNDPDLLFDVGIFCAAGAGASNPERASIGVPNSEPHLQPFPAPNPPAVLGGQRLFDNFYWIGNTGIGAWLITSNDGYILFDTMNSEDDAKNIIVPWLRFMTA